MFVQFPLDEIWRWWLAALSVIIGFASYAHYLREILCGRVKPHLFSWLIWSIMSGICVAAQYAKGAGTGNLIWIQTTVVCFVIALLSIKRGEKSTTVSDWGCLCGALLAIGFWGVTRNPVWAVAIAAVVDTLAFVPTIRKSWGKPQQESLLFYAIACLRYALGIVILESFNVTTMLCPVVTVILNGILVTTIIMRRSFSLRVGCI